MPAIDPKLAALMGKSGPPTPLPPGGPDASPAGGGGMAPVSAPMSGPQENAGEKQQAMLKVQQAMDLLEQALPDFGSESEEGGEILKTLGTLGKKFGGANRARSNELMPAELMNLLSSLPQGQGGMKPMPPSGAPGGAPPGGAAPMPPMPPMA